MEQCLNQVVQHISDIFTYSGKFFMRTGNYNECIATPGMDYYTVNFNQIGNNIALLYASLCLPEVCTPEAVIQAINMVAQQAKVDIRAISVVNRIDEQRYEFTWVFYLTAIMIGLLVAFVSFASIMHWLGRRNNKIVSSMSLQSSLKIFEYNQKSQLNVLNGVRSLAMLWVIFGHQYSMIIINTSNLLSINQILSTWKELVIEAGILAVDTFFFVGGFLVAYSVLRESKMSSSLRYLLAIVNRYLRFLPSYLMAMLIYYSFALHMSSGPYSSQNILSVQKCENLWRSLLYIDNIVDKGNSMCMGWGWYLQNDMQIFVYSVVILLVYGKSRFWGYMLATLSILGSFAYTMQSTYDNEYKYTTHMSDFANYGDYMSYIYLKPWSRCPPYIFGLMLGMLYVEMIVSHKQHSVKNKANNQDEAQHYEKHQKHFLLTFMEYLQDNLWKKRAFEMSGLVIMLFIILIPRTAQGDDHYWPQLVHSFFLTYSKLAFVLGLALLILPSLLGIKGIVSFMLDTKAFNFIAKISFWTYLIHLTVMNAWITSIKIDFYYAYVPLFGLAATTTVQSMLIGFVFCLLVEIPFAKQQKYFMEWAIKKVNAKKNHHQITTNIHNPEINASVSQDKS